MTTTFEIEIVPAKAEHAKDIQSLLRESSRSMYINNGYSNEDFRGKFRNQISDEAINKCARNISSLSENDKYVVAKIEGRIVGLCYVEKEPSKNILHAMYILPEYQNQGIGSQLWKNVRGFLDPTKDTFLYVFDSNNNAIEFYKKLGFISTGKTITEDRFTSKEGVIISEIEMVLKANKFTH